MQNTNISFLDNFSNIYNSEISSILNDNNKKIALKNICGSFYPVFASKIAALSKNHHLFIMQNRESAAFFYHDLELLLNDDKPVDEKKVHYFPSSCKRAYKWDDIDTNNIKLRSEIIYKLLQKDENYLIVTYPEAVSEKILNKKYLINNTFTIRKGDKINIETILEFLYEYQYVQEEFVYEPGQFAWRGGIFDVFSFVEEFPFRIEFNGDFIESVRTFDTSTQLSINEVNAFNVMPPMNHSELQEERVSVFDFLDNNAVLWINKLEDIANQIDNIYANAQDYFIEQQKNDNDIETSKRYILRNDFLHSVVEKSVIEINSTFFSNHSLVIDLKTYPQNNFNKNVNLMVEEWIDNFSKGYKNLFLSENISQIKRMSKIIDDILIKYNAKHFSEYSSTDIYQPLLFILHEGFRNEKEKICVYTDHQLFEKYQKISIHNKYKKSEQFTLKEVYDLQPGDYVVHIDHGIGIYKGLEKIYVLDKEQEAIKLEYKNGDFLYISIHSFYKISKYAGKDGTVPTLHRIGSGTWSKLKEKTKKRVKEIAIDLIKLYAKRKAQKGFAFSVDSYLQDELEASFIYEDTADQVKALAEVKKDMESEYPMDRLICGDVGFGKTEVAIRAAFKAVCDSKQVAVLVPTTVLAMQHYGTFSQRLEKMPCKVDFINRFKTAKEIKEIIKKLQNGELDIIIGTHRLLSKDIIFKNLGLLIIDEEQKFGVAAKEKLREYKATIDTLTLSATPIPRTLQFSLMGARDISVITMPPPNRYSIETEVHIFNENLIKEAIEYEIDRGGQVFVVHNRVDTINDFAALIKKLVPDAHIGIGHGQMEGDKLEKVMEQFVSGDYDVLVATTIIESGLDITNANTMIINDAQNFALNVLHQLRGRVGRSNKKAFCYMLVRSFEDLNDHARKRLKAIEECSELGSGFQIAMRDLDIRGAGDILGAEQSGFISEIGFEMYQKILNEAIAELQDNDYTELSSDTSSHIIQRECLFETDLSASIPSEYVTCMSERMSLYKEINSLKNSDDVEKFKVKLKDLFGQVPKQTEELLQVVPLRNKALELHCEKIVIKNNTFTGYFTPDQKSPFYQSELFANILNFLQKNYPVVQMKEINEKPVLIIKNIPSIKAAIYWLNKI